MTKETVQIITVKVLTNTSEDSVQELSNGHWKVKTMAPAVRGRANKKVLRIIAAYVGVSKRNVTILRGKKSTQKIIQIKKPT